MEIREVAVIGAGTMGAGIAQVCAQAGWKTNLFDAFPEGLERGMARIDAFWDKGIARGKEGLRIGNRRIKPDYRQHRQRRPPWHARQPADKQIAIGTVGCDIKRFENLHASTYRAIDTSNEFHTPYPGILMVRSQRDMPNTRIATKPT